MQAPYSCFHTGFGPIVFPPLKIRYFRDGPLCVILSPFAVLRAGSRQESMPVLIHRLGPPPFLPPDINVGMAMIWCDGSA